MYPMLKRDILLRFFECGLFKARWSDEIIAEWTRNLIQNKPHLEEKVRRTEELIRQSFPDAMVSGYEDLVDALELPDADDRHVLAVAIKCGAEYIVTENLRDFPSRKISKYDVEVGTADAFLTGTFDLFPVEAISDLRVHRLSLSSAPEPSEYIMLVQSRGLPQLASRLKGHRELL